MKTGMPSLVDDETRIGTPPEIHLFQSGRNLTLFGLTVEESGRNLPGEFGPWHRTGTTTSMLHKLTERFAEATGADPVFRAMQTSGFALATSLSAITGTIH
jgi:hypothetical protein